MQHTPVLLSFDVQAKCNSELIRKILDGGAPNYNAPSNPFQKLAKCGFCKATRPPCSYEVITFRRFCGGSSWASYSKKVTVYFTWFISPNRYWRQCNKNKESHKYGPNKKIQTMSLGLFFINSLQPGVAFLYPLKTSENF